MLELFLIIDVLGNGIIVVLCLRVLLFARLNYAKLCTTLSAWDLLGEQILLASGKEECLYDVSTPKHQLSEVSLNVHYVIALRICH